MSLNEHGELALICINGYLRTRFETAEYYARNDNTDQNKTCLFTFRAQQADPDQLPFSATFNCPRIEFACNHEVTLFVIIKEGSYFSRKENKHREIEKECTFAFSIPLEHPIGSEFSNHVGQETIKCKMESAEVQTTDSSADLTELAEYLKEHYIPTLKQAGHDTLCIWTLAMLGIPTNKSYFDYSKGRTINTSSVTNLAASLINIIGPDVPVTGGFIKETHISIPVNEINTKFALQFGLAFITSLCKHDSTVKIEIQEVHQLSDKSSRKSIQKGKCTLTLGVIRSVNKKSERPFGLDRNRVHIVENQVESRSSEVVKLFTNLKSALVSLVKESIDKNCLIGSIYLIHKSFLDVIVVPHLKHVNRWTTLVPVVYGTNSKKRLVFDLVQWENSEAKKGDQCNWNWKRMDTKNMFNWRVGTNNDVFEVGDHNISSSTDNVLTILKSETNGFRAELSGEVKVYQQYRGQEEWSFCSKKEWSAIVVFTFTTNYEMKVEVNKGPDKLAEMDDPEHYVPTNGEPEKTIEKLEKAFPKLYLLDGLAGKLEGAFESVKKSLRAQAKGLNDNRSTLDYDGNLLLKLTIPEKSVHDLGKVAMMEEILTPRKIRSEQQNGITET